MTTSLKPVDAWFAAHQEPAQSTLLYLRKLILSCNAGFTEAWKYGMPFFCINGRMCCYLWIQKKTNLPYVGFVHGPQLNHPLLIQEKRAKMKILVIQPEGDIPHEIITTLVKKAAQLLTAKVPK